MVLWAKTAAEEACDADKGEDTPLPSCSIMVI
jgi:hypothetical protein